MSNKENTKEEKKAAKVEYINDKQLYDLWYLIGQIETQAMIIRSQSKNRIVKDEALKMLTRIETLKNVYLPKKEDGKSNERSN